MSKYDKLIKENDARKVADRNKVQLATHGMTEMVHDAQRTAAVYRNAESELADIDTRFMEATHLNKTDVSFLMLATALQIGRWVVIGLINSAINEKIENSRGEHNDKSIKDMEKERRADFKEKHDMNDSKKSEKYRGWQNLALESVPYDITRGSPKFGINMEGGYHRLHTLGHDPVLGWIFGTMNIISDTITLDKTYGLRTFQVQMMSTPRMWTNEYSAAQGFLDSYESLCEDKRRLPAAVFAQGLHLKSDEYTKLGLPIPALETFVPNLASKIYKEGYDSLLLLKDTAKISIQTVSSILINMLIASIHDLFYNPIEYPSRDLYEVKTRKILSISNTIASSSNILAVAAAEGIATYTDNPEVAKKGWEFFDIGGIMVTMYRLVADTKFIRQVKAEYIENEWYKTVVGEEYKFVSEGQNE